MTPPEIQSQSEQTSLLTFTQQSPPSWLQSALFVSSLQNPSPITEGVYPAAQFS